MGKDEQQAYDEQALQKYQMISPLLDESLDLVRALSASGKHPKSVRRTSSPYTFRMFPRGAELFHFV